MASQDGLDAGDAGFEVTPLTWSPILHTINSELPPVDLSLKTPCGMCGHVGDVMLCLGDNGVFCGRYANGCMLKHIEEIDCKIAISFRDLSIWDYEQDAYLDMYNIAEIQPHYSRMHEIKFGEAARLPIVSNQAGNNRPGGAAEEEYDRSGEGFTLRLETVPPAETTKPKPKP